MGTSFLATVPATTGTGGAAPGEAPAWLLNAAPRGCEQTIKTTAATTRAARPEYEFCAADLGVMDAEFRAGGLSRQSPCEIWPLFVMVCKGYAIRSINSIIDSPMRP